MPKTKKPKGLNEQGQQQDEMSDDDLDKVTGGVGGSSLGDAGLSKGESKNPNTVGKPKS
jgi:hypothetical protein